MDCEEKRRKLLNLVQEFRLIDDTFMTVVFKDKECTQLLIRCLLQRDDLQVVEVFTQRDLKNLWGRSVRLDILATDKTGAIYDIEVQRADSGASQKRARYNSSLLDSSITEPGRKYEELVETYVIFITENDYFEQGLPLYHIERVVQETGASFDDGEHILYVNGQYRGNDPVGSLMHDFFCKRPEEMNNAVLAENVRYYKDDQEGVDYMCRISEEIWNDGKAEGRAEGKAEGEISGIARAVKRLMEKHDFSFAQACEEAGVTKDERPAVEKALHLS
ncbi:PD-(D/E)XK nuclease family transposase [Merdimmobilis hominis]|uniref:PD-(D/E)XK nuclease family transposase n=1 Tax=Merdimmobilis hominis TaxID=2897707 RepID=UPI0008F87665|nr:PD-(D/E)XK nuclease family transposase [Merdimmobilis hominis]